MPEGGSPEYKSEKVQSVKSEKEPNNTFMIWEIADMLYFNHIFVDPKETFDMDEQSESEDINSSSSSMLEDVRINPYSGLYKYYDNIGKIQV